MSEKTHFSVTISTERREITLAGDFGADFHSEAFASIDQETFDANEWRVLSTEAIASDESLAAWTHFAQGRLVKARLRYEASRFADLLYARSQSFMCVPPEYQHAHSTFAGHDE